MISFMMLQDKRLLLKVKHRTLIIIFLYESYLKENINRKKTV